MISHKNIMFSAMQGFIVGALNKAVAPVGSSPSLIATAFELMTTMSSPRGQKILQSH